MHFGIGFLCPPTKKANAFLLCRALRARGEGEVRKIQKPKIFGGKDFRKVCKSVCAFAPPTRAHAPNIIVFRRNYKTMMFTPQKCDTLEL
jgi:hypothetical protein